MTICIKMSLLSLFVCALLICHGCASEQSSMIQMMNPEICQDIKSGKMWQVARGEKFSSLQEAELYAAGLQLGGYDDWRVPTREEYFQMFKIFSLGKNNNCAMSLKGDFWSVPEGGEPALGHWETYFLCGTEFRYVESLKTEGYVRAVRP